jgi:hypothetical protein
LSTTFTRQKYQTNSVSSAYARGTNTSFSGCDIKVWVNTSPYYATGQEDVTNPGPYPLGELHTISVSTFRDKTFVRPLGHVAATGVVRSGRTIAGSLIFSVFNRQTLHQLFNKQDSNTFQGINSDAVLIDQLPPVDISILFRNEYGSVSIANIYGIEFKSEGTVMSISDMLTESSIVYEARHYDPIRPLVEVYHDDIVAIEESLKDSDSVDSGLLVKLMEKLGRERQASYLGTNAGTLASLAQNSRARQILERTRRISF